MRSRPTLKTYLRPGIVRPGDTLHVDVVLASKSETPVDAIELRLDGVARAQYGRFESRESLLALAARHDARVLGVGEHRVAARFAIPADAPATYRGGIASIDYTLTVHVSIPWWPDRRQSFTIPVAPLARPFEPSPQTIVTDLAGPRGSEPYIEAAFDATTLQVGGELAGAVSVSNTRGATIRGVDLELHAIERVRGALGSYEPRVLRWHVHDGAPPEGRPIPFRVTLGQEVGVSVATDLFTLTWRLEVVVRRAWGSDARIRVPVTLVPGGGRTAAEARRWVAPVGRERRALVWAAVAEKLGMEHDVEGERLAATVGGARLTIAMQPRGGKSFTVAELAWNDLGIDLRAEPRSWTDALARDAIELTAAGDDGAATARRITVRAREAAQARAVLGADALAALAPFEEIHVDDDGAKLASPSGAQTAQQLERFVVAAIGAARALAGGLGRVPPPASMAAAVGAWEACAERLGGRLHRGAMRITSTTGADAVEIATLWSRDGAIEGTAVRVRLAPPLERAIDVASPELSPEARELAKAIVAEAKETRLGPETLEALYAGPLDDPARAEPFVERLARLARAARGAPAAGPFR